MISIEGAEIVGAEGGGGGAGNYQPNLVAIALPVLWTYETLEISMYFICIYDVYMYLNYF